MRRWVGLAAVVGWGALALAMAGLAIAAPSRPALLGFVGSAAGFGLAFLGWNSPSPSRWGSVVWLSLVVAPFLGAIWWASPLALLLAVPPAVMLLGDPAQRRPVLPAERRQAAMVLLLAYALLAPPLDALLMRPPSPLEPTIRAPGYVAASGDQRRLAAGAGALWETRATPPEGPSVGIVRIALLEGEALPSALRASYAPGSEASLGPLLFFGFFLDVRERRADQAQLSAEWSRIDVVDESTTIIWLVPIPDTSGRRDVFLLREVPSATQLSLMPPFLLRSQQRVGFHLSEEGNATAALQGLDGNVTVGGVTLRLPPSAYADLSAGSYHRTAGFETVGVLASGLLALALTRLASRGAKR